MGIFTEQRVERIHYPERVLSFAIAFDKRFLPHAGAMLCSFSHFAKQNCIYEIIVLSPDLEAAERLQIETLCRGNSRIRFRWVDMQDAFAGLPPNLPYQSIAYYRLALPEVLQQHAYVIYLDTDIILNADPAGLEPFFRDDVSIVAAPNGSAYYCDPDALLEHYQLNQKDYYRQVIGLDAAEVGMSFNSGVMLMHLSRMRESSCLNAFSALLPEPFRYADQDILNRLYPGKLHGLLPLAWNVENFQYVRKYVTDPVLFRQQLAARRNPKIIHYTDKPFQAKSWRYEAPLSKYYWFWLKKTPWYHAVRGRFEAERKQLKVKRETFVDSLRYWLRDLKLVKKIRGL